MIALLLARMTTVVIGAWLLSLAGTILVSALRGRIVTAGLLSARGSGGMSPSRLQLLIVTVLFGAGYLGTAAGHADSGTLPDIPIGLVAALLGSHGAYLGGKYWSMRA